MRQIFCVLTIVLLGGWTIAYCQTVADGWADRASAGYDIIPNQTYSVASGKELKLDLYIPRDKAAPKPTLILFHGGGWVAGEKERNVMYLLPYLSMGWAVANVEYRTSTTAPAPAAVEDCRCALRWVAANTKQHNIDTSKLVLTGTSAGGHLSLMTAMLPKGSPFDRQCPTGGDARWISDAEPDINVAAVVNWYGITDVADLLEGANAKHYAIEWFGSRPDRIDLAKQLSPLSYVRRGSTPVITMHGDQDNVVPYDHAVRLHDALAKGGVENELVTIKGRSHGGFSAGEMSDSYIKVRAFLKKIGVLSK